MMLLVSRLVCRFAKDPLKRYGIEPEKLPDLPDMNLVEKIAEMRETTKQDENKRMSNSLITQGIKTRSSLDVDTLALSTKARSTTFSMLRAIRSGR